ncbi:cupin domain-containing protein [Altererythrobacter sp. KTW20L]|uniref:cupin domain-containing protein n=1 Tax=Altererythrobacter sp. KTW20L TaxID=2942210 RepID=UPI0020BD6031|nr:cupin domain-containing protein [Altererythrobacter sp. KTW20L]MCL6250773.1 cupin domain-containing protein [Altererythrobacter sp. KTW20L]
MKLTNFDIDLFLRDYWQKKPLLIRNPWDRWTNPLEPDELAGLACEEGVESRLVVRQGEQLALEAGPLPEERFGQLDGDSCTLLVQAVDHYVADVAALIEPFRFVPDWRIDDVMVSWAANGGGVGPHFDQYDVFLVQGLGRRRWRIGPLCDSTTPLQDNDDLRLIADFVATDEWVLEPGDILYVPPRFAHDGVAVSDDCMTYSIGFRAPSLAELVEGWCEHQADASPDELRFADPDLARQANAGEIAPPALDRLYAMVSQALADRPAFDRWFGCHATQPKYPDIDWRPEDMVDEGEVLALMAAGTPLVRNPASRFAFTQAGDGAVVLFVDGEAFECSGDLAEFAPILCAATTVQAPATSAEVAALVATLVNRGSLAFEEAE